MSRFEYLYKAEGNPVKVKLDGRVIGEIRRVPEGWQYYPKGRKNGGDVFSSYARVKQSIEAD